MTRNTAAPHAISMTETFDAPLDLVFRNWTEAEHVRAWFAPDGYTVTLCEIDARPGGCWRVEFESASGERHIEHGEFHEVVAPERLVFTLVQEDGRGRAGPNTIITVTFTERGARTEITFHQAGFTDPATRDGNAQGWGECFRKLAAHLAG